MGLATPDPNPPDNWHIGLRLGFLAICLVCTAFLLALYTIGCDHPRLHLRLLIAATPLCFFGLAVASALQAFSLAQQHRRSGSWAATTAMLQHPMGKASGDFYSMLHSTLYNQIPQELQQSRFYDALSVPKIWWQVELTEKYAWVSGYFMFGLQLDRQSFMYSYIFGPVLAAIQIGLILFGLRQHLEMQGNPYPGWNTTANV